jgi:hypothetical protein
MATKKTVDQMLSMIGLANPGLKILHPANNRAYLEILESIPDDVLMAVVNKMLRQDISFWPGAGKIFQACTEYMFPAINQTALESHWNHILELISGDQWSSSNPDYSMYVEAVRAVGAVFDIKTATGFQLNQMRTVFMEALKKKLESDRENRITAMVESGSIVKQLKP